MIHFVMSRIRPCENHIQWLSILTAVLQPSCIHSLGLICVLWIFRMFKFFPSQCHVIKCSVLVCWLGRESLQRECVSLVKKLWSQGISADLLYESIDVDSVEDIQDFCRRNFIPHVVILNDKTLFFERKQVSLTWDVFPLLGLLAINFSCNTCTCTCTIGPHRPTS